MDYDYKEGKKRIEEILNDPNDYETAKEIPSDAQFTYDNGYYGWVGAIFVDIRDSTSLFAENKKSSTAKIVRSFSSEIIEILKSSEKIREIGIRGDCVYAIYSCPYISDDLDLLEKTFYINTFLDMLNSILKKRNIKEIKAGIGLALHQDLVIKAGRKSSGINSKVWIGEAATYASKLSNIANKNGNEKILMSSEFYNAMIKKFREDNSNYKQSWIRYHNDSKIGSYYGCNLIKTNFSNWIDGGMKDE